MGLNTAKNDDPTPATPEEVRGYPAEPDPDQSMIRSAISDASDIEKYVAKALEAIKSEDYESAKGYLLDIESSSTSAVKAMTEMEVGLSAYDDWGSSWKQDALSRPDEVIEMLEAQYKSCINQVTEIQADEDLPTRLIDEKSNVVIGSWGVKDPELAAVILAVCKIRGEELYQKRKGPQPVVPMETKIREITGAQRRPFF